MTDKKSDMHVQQDLRLSCLKCALGVAGAGIQDEGNRVREAFEPTQYRYLELASGLGYDIEQLTSWTRIRTNLIALLDAIENDETLSQSYPSEESEFEFDQYVIGYRFIIETPTEDQKDDDGEYYAVAIAKQLTSQLATKGCLSQENARNIVIRNYGPAYTYTNHSGGRSINKVVLEHFRRIRPASTWDSSNLEWRLVQDH